MATAQDAIVVNQWQICELCKRMENINWKCIHCLQILCDACREIHINGRTTMDHFIFNKSEAAKESTFMQIHKCRTHLIENVAFYCNDDKECICEQCIFGKHRGHDVHPIVDSSFNSRTALNETLREILSNNEKRKTELEKLLAEIKRIETNLQGVEENAKALTGRLNTTRDTEFMRQKDNFSAEVGHLQRRVEFDDLNRLINEVRQKLETYADNPNTPQKLAGMFSEIYDNEWTDAYDALKQTYGDERQIITELLSILKDCNEHCRGKANELLVGLSASVKKVAFGDQNTVLPGTSSRKIKDFRKSLEPELLPCVQSDYFQHKKIQSKVLTNYITKCLKFCWSAAVQDPPVYIEFMENHENAPFDSDKMKEYTRKGKIIDFVVWPVLYLHENGALLAKGVAQGKIKWIRIK